MNNNQTIPFSTEGLRTAAHSLATVLYSSAIGGECYHGGKHTCFVRQGRKPLSTYKVEDMCERCATAWHAVMAATLLDSIVIGQQFLNKEAPGQHVLRPFGAFVPAPAALTPTPVTAGSFDARAKEPWVGLDNLPPPKPTTPIVPPRASKASKATKPAPKASAKPKSLVCGKCARKFTQSNARTMHERFCSGAKK
jgi:hypothetical protein